MSEITSEDLIAEEDMVVTLSHTGYVKRSPLSEYRAQKRGGRGKTGATTKEDDFVTDLFVASTHAYLMPITTKGKLYSLKVHQIPAASRTSRGKAIVNLVQFGEGEKLAQVLVTRDFPENRYVFFVTKRGVVKRTDLSSFANVRSSGMIALGIDEGDELVAVKITDGSQGHPAVDGAGHEHPLPGGRGALDGPAGLRREGHHPGGGRRGGGRGRGGEGCHHPHGDGERLRQAHRGDGVPLQGRGGKGIIDIKTTERNGKVVGLVQVKDADEVMLVTNGGMLIRMKAKEISVIGRNTQGVRLIALENGEEKVTAISKLPESSNESEETLAADAASTPPGEEASAEPVSADESSSSEEPGSGEGSSGEE